MSDFVTLTCRWGRMPVPASASPQVGYLLVEAVAQASPTTAMPLNLCFVLDRSGSMQGAKLESLKAATRKVIELLRPQDVAAIVIFDDTVQTLVPATPVGDRSALLAAVDSITEAGGTAMSLGMKAGQVELQKYLGPDRISRMLLLTDGQTWGDEPLCRDLARELGQAGARITALGLGVEWNEQLLDDIAAASDGYSDYIADPAQITTFFQQAVQTAQATVATDARLLLRFVRDVTPRAVYRVKPVIANLGYQPIGETAVATRLGDLVGGEPTAILLDVMLPPRASGRFRIAQAELHLTPVGQSTEMVIKQDVLLEVADQVGPESFVPGVMNLVERVTAFKLQTRALSEAASGNVAGATQKLRAAATRLLDLGELELAEKTNQQATALEQGRQLSPEAQKELRYATRRLTQRLEDE
ncbi:vWA domain-containing protein [Chloroflexus sp.]|uniref:vWA domain-containing protein n=1 Tax=Chloroflexus sp. TaxID=1904827 RepID=UPI0026320A19|nr:VWA domain-containing protein [uncultured Chloroflexus sp.]